MSTPIGTHVQISDEINFNTPLINDDGNYKTNYNPPINTLTRGINLYVRARHKTSTNYTDWGTTKQFKIKEYEKWVVYVNAGQSYTFRSIKVLDDGSWVTVGDWHPDSYYYNFIAKWTNTGTLAWFKYTSGTYNKGFFYNVCVDTSNNIYASGYTQNGAVCMGCIMKLTYYGTVSWFKWYSQPCIFYAMTIDDENNLYFAGHYGDGFPGIIKTDSNCILSWQKYGTTYGIIYDLKYHTNGYLYGVGYTTVGGVHRGHFLKIEKSGVISLDKYIDIGNYPVYFTGVDIDSDNNAYCVGWMIDNSTPYETAWSFGIVAKLNNAGALNWVVKTQYTSRFFQIYISTGGIFIVGRNAVDQVLRPYIARITENGVLMWGSYLQHGAYNGELFDVTSYFNITSNIYAIGCINNLTYSYPLLLTITPDKPIAGSLPSISAFSWVDYNENILSSLSGSVFNTSVLFNTVSNNIQDITAYSLVGIDVGTNVSVVKSTYS